MLWLNALSFVFWPLRQRVGVEFSAHMLSVLNKAFSMGTDTAVTGD